MIRNIMFDLGGVIMDIKRENAVAALQAIGMADADNMLGVYGQKGPFLQLEKGEITIPEFRSALRPYISGNPSDDQIDDAFCRFLIGIPADRLHQLEQLRSDGYGIYLLSNTNPLMWERFILPEFRKDGHDINHYFDGIVTSFEEHAYKPDAAIFNRAAQKFGIKPAETIFLDDSAANCEAARRCGFEAAHVSDTTKPFASYL